MRQAAVSTTATMPSAHSRVASSRRIAGAAPPPEPGAECKRTGVDPADKTLPTFPHIELGSRTCPDPRTFVLRWTSKPETSSHNAIKFFFI